MNRPTRLVLTDVDGKDATNMTIDVTNIPNADARTPLTIIAIQQCDMGHWHRVSDGMPAPLYDTSISLTVKNEPDE
jgi:hypothetical protein